MRRTTGGDEPLTPAEVLRLQQTAGNQAVLRLLHGWRRTAHVVPQQEADAGGGGPSSEQPATGPAPEAIPPEPLTESTARVAEHPDPASAETAEPGPAETADRWWRRLWKWLRGVG